MLEELSSILPTASRSPLLLHDLIFNSENIVKGSIFFPDMGTWI